MVFRPRWSLITGRLYHMLDCMFDQYFQHKFYDYFDEEDAEDEEQDAERDDNQVLCLISDSDGSLDMETVKSGEQISRDDLSSDVSLILHLVHKSTLHSRF